MIDMRSYTSLHGFEFISHRAIAELSATAHEAVHVKSGARLLFLEREDSNKTFAITFKTIPEDSTGVFHILEHSVLCGSEKYPVKEPFVELLKGSLKTFLNAFTFPDKTMYPISSRNDKDFLNLMDVYMDAVLHPLATRRPEIFMQEGWHYEVADDGSLSYKGVVFNEMKGAYSSADEIEMELMSSMLYEGSTYAHDSGGAPRAIPTLTYEQFVSAHKRYYHPSNSRIFLDGAVDLDAALALLDGYLSKYDADPCEITVPLELAAGHVERTVEYEIGAGESPEGKCRVCLGFDSHSYEDRRTGMALGVIIDAIASTNDAPFKRAMLDCGICEDASFISYDGIKENSVIIEIKNVKACDTERAAALALETVRRIAQEGIDRSALVAAFNSMEFRIREQDSAGFPQGINYAIAVQDTWLYGGDPVAALAFEDDVAALRAALDTDYYERLLRTVFLESKHSATLYMIPSATLGERTAAEERATLDAARAAMSEGEVSALRQSQARLVAWQESEDSDEALATLPSLTVSDIEPEPERIPGEIYKIDTVPALYTSVPSRGITYTTLLFNVTDLDAKELMHLSVMTELFKNLPTARYSARELQTRIKSELGSLAVSILTSTRDGECGIYLALTASALDSALASVTDLAGEVMLTTDFSDTEAIGRIVRQLKTATAESIAASGHSAALSRSASYVSREAVLTEYTDGIEFYLYLKELEAGYSSRAAELCASLSALCRRVVTRERITVCHSGKRNDSFAEELVNIFPHGGACQAKTPVLPLGRRREGVVIPASVAYVGVAGDLSDLCDNVHGSFGVVRTLLSYGYLWGEIRVQGGAYGAGFVKRRNGVAGYYTYRDPDAARSLEKIGGSTEYLRAFAASGEDITPYVIGAVGDSDSIMTPKVVSALSTMAYLSGQTYEDHLRTRREMIETSAEDLISAADLIDRMLAESGFCVIGGREKIAALGNLDSVIEI